MSKGGLCTDNCVSSNSSTITHGCCHNNISIFQRHFELCGLLPERGDIIPIGFIDVNYVGDLEEHKS